MGVTKRVLTPVLRFALLSYYRQQNLITIQKNLPQQKQVNIRRVAIHYSHNVHARAAKAYTIFTEVLTA